MAKAAAFTVLPLILLVLRTLASRRMKVGKADG
jgi:hypothetical protein